jgi:Mg-chelatase subunit ChlD
MSIALTSSFLSAPSALNAETRPIRAVRIVPTAPAAVARRPFHLVLALDVSGSMEGPRIVAVQRTLTLLLDGLANGDTLSMISYESRARILARAVRISAESRPTLMTAVDNLRADGGTNLEAALVSLRTITSDSTIPSVDAVFVLTDGHINQGLTSSAGLTRLLTSAVPTGTPVFTLGFGADHNSRMLRDMALRTRGSYTYADAAELIPATIADILTGLATEVGREGRLLLPAGWRALEITAAADATEFNVGTLIADKEQWVVLEGPPGPCDPPALTFVWRGADGAEHTETCATFTDFESVLVSEQYCRCRVATVQTSVQEMLEARRIDEARVALTELGAWLDASPAHDRPFVISLRAQVDEMVEALVAAPMPGLARAGAGGIFGSAGVGLAPILSRMASNTAALGAQRGMMSHISSVEPADPSAPTAASAGGGRATASGVTHMFCSPTQQRSITTTRARYSQMASEPPATEDEEVDLDSVARSLGLALPPVLQRVGRLTPLATEEEPNEPLMTPPPPHGALAPAPAPAPSAADGQPPVDTPPRPST